MLHSILQVTHEGAATALLSLASPRNSYRFIPSAAVRLTSAPPGAARDGMGAEGAGAGPW